MLNFVNVSEGLYRFTGSMPVHGHDGPARGQAPAEVRGIYHTYRPAGSPPENFPLRVIAELWMRGEEGWRPLDAAAVCTEYVRDGAGAAGLNEEAEALPPLRLTGTRRVVTPAAQAPIAALPAAPAEERAEAFRCSCGCGCKNRYYNDSTYCRACSQGCCGE